MNTLIWVLIGFHAMGAITTAASVGKPRKPIDGGTAAISIGISLLIIIALIIWGLK